MGAGLLGILFCGSTNLVAALVEDFNYSDGNLTTVSSGAWQFWEPGASNASVSNGKAIYTGTTDVIRTFPAVLTAPGQTATISFTLAVGDFNTSERYQISFLPSSAPFAANSNYGSGLTLFFNYDVNLLTERSLMQAGDGQGNGTQSVWSVGYFTLFESHNITIDLNRGATTTTYSIFMDDVFAGSSSFVLNDARAINAVELAQTDSIPSASSSASIDNLRIVPEPATSMTLLAGGVILLNLRRRARKIAGL